MALFNLFSQNPLTLSDLINIDQGRQERSQVLSVSLDRVYKKVKKESLWDRIKSLFKRNSTTINMYYTILKFTVKNPSNGNSYGVIIEFQPNMDVNKILNNKVRVYCECPSFKYQSAYFLNKRGNLFRSSKTDTYLGQALTDAPDTKRTKVSPICKHVYACVNWMNNNISYLLNNI